MKLTRGRLLLLLTVIFISLNAFLVVKDSDGKVNRTSYIKNWTEADQKDMYDRLETVGVLDYTEEQFVYLEGDVGNFQTFLVDEGVTVFAGRELYTYQVENYDETKSQLENEVERLEAEISAVEAAIDKMKRTNIVRGETQVVYPDNEIAAVFPHDASAAELLKEQYRIEKENELEQKEAELNSVQSQLADLTAGEETITVQSPFDGKVTNISKTLENPIMTIETPDLHMIGELSESERAKVEEGMVTEITFVEVDLDEMEELQGVVTYVSDEPKEVMLKGNSVYPFEVTFDEELTIDQLLQGYHVNLEIMVAESPDAVVIDEELLDEEMKIWKMSRSGILTNKEIEAGIQMDAWIEVREDLQSDDWIAIAAENNFYDGTTFITPFKPSKAKWKDIYNNGPRKRSLLIGLLGR